MTFEIAENGKEAIDKFMSEKPDLILMDIQMPIMDGVQACLSIRDIDPNIPIVALTANVMKEDIEQYHASGFSSHLAKPVEIETLYSELVKFI